MAQADPVFVFSVLSVVKRLSFAVMKDEGIADALTGDPHFEQAGFRPLLKWPFTNYAVGLDKYYV